MESHSPILWIQFAQSHYHLSENKWEAEGRTGWKERHVTGQWEKQPQTEADRQTDRRTPWRKIPTSNRTKRLAEQVWDKSNSLPQEVENYSSAEKPLKRREREQEKGWKEWERGELKSSREKMTGRKKKKRSGRTGMSSARLNILSQCEELNWPNRAMRQSSIPVNKSWGQRRGLQMLQHKIKKYAHKSTLGSENMVAWLI